MTVGVCDAQKLVKGFSRLERGDTAKAVQFFKKKLKKHVEPHAAYYGLGLCLQRTQPKQAFINYRKTDGKFRNSGKDFHKYMLTAYGITPDSVRLKLDEIAAAQLRIVINRDSTERGFMTFRRAYKGCAPRFEQRAARLQEEAAYREARADKTLKKAKKFTENYPYSTKLNFIVEFIDSVEYFNRLIDGNISSLARYMKDYEKGKLFSRKGASIAASNAMRQSYYSQARKLRFYLEPGERLTDDFMKNWRREVYYSGHWNRLKFFYERLPHMMDDSLRRMYYSGLYGEDNYGTNELMAYYMPWSSREYFEQRDSLYDYYIQRGAPSLLAFRKMQELYADDLAQGRLKKVIAIIDKYAPLFPNRAYEITQLKKLITEDKDKCVKVRLPEVINAPPMRKPDIRYFDINGRKVAYNARGFDYMDGVNKYPVISPDGKRLYFTHWEYKIIKIRQTVQYLHKKSGKRIDMKKTTEDTVRVATGIVYSDYKNGRWQPFVPVEGLYKRDSIRSVVAEDQDFGLMYQFDPSIGLKFLADKSINAKREDTVLYYVACDRWISKDSLTHYVSGVSNDNTTLYIIKNEKVKVGLPTANQPQEHYIGKMVDATSQVGNGSWAMPRPCGHLNHYYRVNDDGVIIPSPFFGSFNAHPSPDNSAIFFAAGRYGVPAWREDFTIQYVAATNKGQILTSDHYANMFFQSGGSHPKYYSDIWVSEKREDGVWDYPVNLGDAINSEYGEYSPVLAADNKTLYFVSGGRLGMGGTDIYMCKRTDPTSWTKWTAPVNLGKYINTPYNEHDFSITADGKTAYYTSEEPATHRQIFYKVDLPMAFRPDTIAIYKGKVTNLGGEPLNARIRVEDVSTHKTYAEYRTQMPSGEFYFGLPQDRPYRFIVSTRSTVPGVDTLSINTFTQIVRTHDFKLADSVEIFAKRLPIRLDAMSDAGVVTYLQKYIDDIPALEITASAPSRSAAEARAAAIKDRLVAAGFDEKIIFVAVWVGKQESSIRIVER